MDLKVHSCSNLAESTLTLHLVILLMNLLGKKLTSAAAKGAPRPAEQLLVQLPAQSRYHYFTVKDLGQQILCRWWLGGGGGHKGAFKPLQHLARLCPGC